MKHTRIFLLVAVVFVLALSMVACTPEHQHTWVDADCDTPKTCSECGETEGEALGHALEELIGKEATCSEAGLTDGAKCSVCGEVVTAQTEIAKLPHTEEVIKGKDATCTEPGFTDGKKCTVCGETIEAQKVIGVLDHTEEVIPGKDANCIETGLTEGKKCTVCGTVTVAQDTIPAVGHKDENGDYECDVCKTDLCTTHVPAAAVEENRVDATCTVAGSYDSVVRCSQCKEELSRETIAIPVIAHTEEVIPGKDANCIETGLTEGKKCTVCGTVTLAQETLPALGHKDENGDYECDVCKTDLCTTHVPAAAVEENRVDATCTVAGSYESVVKCAQCGEEISRDTVAIPAPGHVEAIMEGKTATCTESGISEGKMCTKCNEVLVPQVTIDALGHAYGEVSYVWADDKSSCTASVVCARDAAHTISESVNVSVVALNVSASKVTFAYTASFASEILGSHTVTVEEAVTLSGNVATVNAPAMSGKVASHDYVKFDFNNADATYNFDIYYSEISVWDGVSVSEGLAGSGTAEDPYLIQSAADLAYIAKVVNALEVKTAAFSDNYIVLTKSIDLNGHELHIGTGRGWADRKMFAAHLDGNNCTIRGINNTLPLFGCVEGGSVKNLSLYGEVNVAQGNDSTGVFVGYLRLAPLTNITNYATMNGRGNVGGIVGNMEQSNDNPSTYLVNYGAITGVQNVGGIAGLIGRKLENCTNWGTVNGNNNVGGIVGNLYWACSLTSCSNYGTVTGTTVVGGIAGALNGSINAELTGCVNYGNVSGKTCTSTAVDAITPVGATKTDCSNYGTAVIPAHEITYTDAKAATCEADGNVAYGHCAVCEKNYDADGKEIAKVVIAALGHAYVGGDVVNGKITFTCGNCGHSYEQEAKQIITVNHLNLDGSDAAAPQTLEFDYNSIATIYAKEINGYVASHDYVKVHVLDNSTVNIYYSEVSVWDGTSVSASLSGTGTEADPFLIQSAADFAYFASVINAVEGAAGVNYKVTTFKGQYFKMTKSIDLNGHYLIVGFHAGWNNYQGFFGHFNGNNCSIRGINIDNSKGSTSTALFGCVNAGSIKNLSVYGEVKGNATVGGLVAYSVTNAIIENVTSYINVTSKVANGRQGTVGGIVANQENSAGALLNCVNYGTVICDSYIVGGIVGSGGKDITNCVNWGSVTGGNVSVGGISGSTKDKGTISGCVNYGTVTGATTAYGQIGGIVGTAKKPVSNCVNYGTVIGTTSKGVGQIYGTTTTTVTDCKEYGEIKEYVVE